MVLRGIGGLDIGLAAVGGIGIVILAMILDRITRGIAEQARDPTPWTKLGFVGFILSFLAPARSIREERV